MDHPGEVRDDERLRRLHAVTDAALSRLEVSDLLDELLDRVRTMLHADNAVILMRDPHARELVATAAKGLPDAVHHGVRIPIGRGFAGRVAEARQPVLLADVTAADVISPVLLAHGVRSLLGVPIFAAGEVIGVLLVGTLTRREFTADDVSLLQLAADRAGVAGQIHSRQVELTAALALQRSLLPTQLPAVAGLRMAAGMCPATNSASAATGTTCSPCPPGGSAWSSATSPATVWPPRS